MRRSGHLSGATVALDLLPKDIACDTTILPKVRILDLETSPVPTPDAARARLCATSLQVGEHLVALAPVVAFAILANPDSQTVSETAPTQLPEVLGHRLNRLLQNGAIDAPLLYCCALCFAMLTRGSDAQTLLSAIPAPTSSHPAILALSGYLALQAGEAEVGRRALARAALAARGSVPNRGILHFTQHVLLVHQFNG